MTRSRAQMPSSKENKAARTGWLIVISLLVLGAAYCLPMFLTGGIHKCDDTTFHVGRLVGLANVWASPVNFDNFGNNGLMVNIFYPWLTMYPMRLLYMAAGSYVMAYKLYYVMLTIAALLTAYFSMRAITRSDIPSFIFAVVCVFSSYRFADVYNRDALGESIALTFLPLVLLGLYKVCFDDCREWRKLAAGMTLIAYSHMLSLVMSAAFTALVFLAAIITQGNRKQRFISMIKAAALSLGLSAAMLFPMIEQLVRNDLFMPQGDGDTMSKSAYSLSELISFSLRNNPAGRGIGLMSVAALLLSVVFLVYRLIAARGRTDSSDKLAICLMVIGIGIFICTSDMLPWKYLGDNTPLSTIQFVWRMNAYPTLAFAAAFAILLSKTVNSTRKGAIILLTAAVLMTAGLQYFTLYARNSEMTGSKVIAEKDIATWPSGNVDYTPYQAKEYRDAHPGNMEYILADGSETEESPETDKSGSWYIQDIGGSDSARVVDIPVFSFYGETVRINGEPAEYSLSERGTTKIEVPASAGARISISYEYTPFARLSWAFSLILLLADAVIMARSAFRKRI